MGKCEGETSFASGTSFCSSVSTIMDLANSIDSEARFSFFFCNSNCHGGTSGSSFFGFVGGGLARGLDFTFGISMILDSSAGGCEGGGAREGGDACEDGGGVCGGGGGGLSSFTSELNAGVFLSGMGGGPTTAAGLGGSLSIGSSILGSRDSTPSSSAFCIRFCLLISFFNSSFSASGSGGGRGLGVGLRLGRSRVAV